MLLGLIRFYIRKFLSPSPEYPADNFSGAENLPSKAAGVFMTTQLLALFS
jgi:hypothetical protein